LKDILLHEDQETMFLDYLDYLNCFTSQRYLVIDVKYNSVHHIGKTWQCLADEPFLFTLIKKHNLRVLNLTRRHFVRYYISEKRAQTTRRWYDFGGTSIATPQEEPLVIDLNELLHYIRLCQSENALVENFLASYEHYFTIDYQDLFPSIGAPLSSAVLEQIAAWLGIENADFQADTDYKKQSFLPLDQAIKNYDEVARALRGTAFEYCLEDEPLYRPVHP
jgi:hypothetical protein